MSPFPNSDPTPLQPFLLSLTSFLFLSYCLGTSILKPSDPLSVLLEDYYAPSTQTAENSLRDSYRGAPLFQIALLVQVVLVSRAR